MGKIIVEKLQEDVPKGSFYCGNGSIERMIEDSYFVTQLQHAFAFKVYDDRNYIIGYYDVGVKTINKFAPIPIVP